MRRHRAVLAVVVAAATATAAHARQWIVDDDGPAEFSSIQAAIDAPYVASGDTLLVRPGIYREVLSLSSKDLVIRSERGPALTVVDAQRSGSVVSLLHRGSATRVEGLTLTNGSDQTGGGVWIVGGAPVITRNVIEGNEALGGSLGYGYGGGIEVYAAAPTITHNVIRGNTALDGGAGIDVYYSGPATPGTCCPILARNTIVDNVVSGPGGKGGGILIFASQPSLTSSVLSGNVAASGGGLFVEDVPGNQDSPAVSTNLFFDNVPDAAGSSGGWHLPASNLHADPRFTQGEGSDLWPGSDSPALDRAEPGLPPEVPSADGDLDGEIRPDLGAFESLGEVTGLRLSREAGVPVLRWAASVNPAARFHVIASDGDPFVDPAGACLATLVPTLSLADPAPLPPGGVRYYVVTAEAEAAGSPGLRTDGSSRALPACALPVSVVSPRARGESEPARIHPSRWRRGRRALDPGDGAAASGLLDEGLPPPVLPPDPSAPCPRPRPGGRDGRRRGHLDGRGGGLRRRQP